MSRDAARLFEETGIDLAQVQEIPVDGDPDVEALKRQQIDALKTQASIWMTRHMYVGSIPQTVISACDFCRLPVPANGLRYKMVRFIGSRPLGGMACFSCYPLDKQQLRRVAERARKER